MLGVTFFSFYENRKSLIIEGTPDFLNECPEIQPMTIIGITEKKCDTGKNLVRTWTIPTADGPKSDFEGSNKNIKKFKKYVKKVEQTFTSEETEVKIEEDTGEEGLVQQKVEEIEEIKNEKPENDLQTIQLISEDANEDLKTEEPSEVQVQNASNYPEAQTSSGFTPIMLPGSSGIQIQLPGQFQTNQGSGIDGLNISSISSRSIWLIYGPDRGP